MKTIFRTINDNQDKILVYAQLTAIFFIVVLAGSLAYGIITGQVNTDYL